MHSFRVETDEYGNARVFLDGKDISSSCTGYSIDHSGGIPEIEVRLLCREIEIEEKRAKIILFEEY